MPPATAAAPSVKAATTIEIRGGAAARGRNAAPGASSDIVTEAAVTGEPHASASKAATRATAGGKGSINRPTTAGVMQQMAQQLPQALGRGSSTVTSLPPAEDRRDGGSTADSNLFAIAYLPPRAFSTTRSSSNTDLPRSLSHNDDF